MHIGNVRLSKCQNPVILLSIEEQLGAKLDEEMGAVDFQPRHLTDWLLTKWRSVWWSPFTLQVSIRRAWKNLPGINFSPNFVSGIIDAEKQRLARPTPGRTMAPPRLRELRRSSLSWHFPNYHGWRERFQREGPASAECRLAVTERRWKG
jgi:hypothetical protein